MLNGVLPGVAVELRGASGAPRLAASNERGEYRFDALPPGRYALSFSRLESPPACFVAEVTGCHLFTRRPL